MKFGKNWRESISSQLLKSIFGIYFVIAILVTVIQIGLESQNVKKDIVNQLKTLQSTFGPSIQQALWTYDTKALKASTKGIMSNSYVKGLIIFDSNNEKVEESGAIKAAKGDSFIDQLFSIKFDIKHTKDGAEQLVGKGEFFSSNLIIFNRIKYSLILIILNSIVKTTLLWLIMIFFTKKYLERPLDKLKQELEDLDIEDIKKLDYVTSRKNQFTHLIDAYNGLLERLKSYREQIMFNQKNLQNLIAKKTHDLEEALKEVKYSDSVKEQFLANISHEVRTPLNGIIGISEILETKQEITEDQRQYYVRDLKTSAKNLLLLLDSIIDLSKVNTNQIELKNSNFNLKKLGEELVVIFSGQASEKGCQIECVYQEDLPESVFFDRKRLKQALFNFVHNAVKFTDFGEIKIKFSTEGNHCTSHPCPLLIEVTDTGIGIPQDELTNIFKPFVQKEGQSINDYSGIGLGLGLSEGIIKVMNGSVSVESDVGKGTKFIIKIPEVKFIDVDDIKEMDDVDPLRIKLSKSRILYVEDDSVNREVVFNYLRRQENLEVFSAVDGEEAIQLARDKKPDISLIDLHLPKINGDKLSEMIRNEKLSSHIICLTRGAHNLNNEKMKFFDITLVKPVSESSLIEALSRYIEFEVSQEQNVSQVEENVAKDNLEIQNQEEFDKALSHLHKLIKKGIESNTLNDIEDAYKSLDNLCNLTNWKPLLEIKKDYMEALSLFNMQKLDIILIQLDEFLDSINQQAA